MEKTFTKACITTELSQIMITAAISKALEIAVPMSIAILDESGRLKAFQQMDGALLISIETSQDKAYSGLSGLATDELYDYIKQTPETLLGMPHIPRLRPIGGGFPIKVDGEIIGAIGIGGGSADQDMVVAKAALAVLES